MVYLEKIFVMSSQDVEMIKISEHIKQVVKNSGISEGLVTAITAHTTTGITVNEGLWCLEIDIIELLKKLVPDNTPYTHAHFLPTYGRTSANATGHLRGLLLGNNCVFPIENGELVIGAAQDAYLVELDGPQNRKICISVMGEQ